jgi:hypothetical protein
VAFYLIMLDAPSSISIHRLQQLVIALKWRRRQLMLKMNKVLLSNGMCIMNFGRFGIYVMFLQCKIRYNQVNCSMSLPGICQLQQVLENETRGTWL